MTSEQQIEKVQQDIEGMLNDFESGITEKDETIVLLRNYIYERSDQAVKNYKSNKGFDRGLKPGEKFIDGVY